MTYTRQIKYDYKIRLDWGKPERRRARLARGLARVAVVLAAPAAIMMLGGMASDELLRHQFKLPPWGDLVQHETATPDSVFMLPPPGYFPGDIDVKSSVMESAGPAADGGQDGVTKSVGATGDGTTDAQAGRDGSSPADDWQVVKVKNGDNLSLIFGRLGLSAADLDKILSLNGDTAELKRLSPDQSLRFRIKDGSLQEMVHEMDHQHSLHISRQDDGFRASVVQEPVEIRQAQVSATIENSLFGTGQAAGLSDAMIMKLADVFGYDIDFALDLREGDRFTVVYDQIYKNGKKIKDGDIVAAEFVNQNHVYRAVRYVDPDGHADYYSADGHSLKKAFLRTPVAFTRISSYFSLARKHPILNTIRAHKGVDYAAPIGTPIRATGDGKVAFAGWHGGYGNLIMLQHAGNYTTVYGHLSRYAKGIKTGVAVHQGQIIGYVGMTGLATGPHLHYEFRIAGVFHDPLTVKLPTALPIASKQMPDFLAKTRPLLAELDDAVQLAASGAHPNSAGPGTAPETVASAKANLP